MQAFSRPILSPLATMVAESSDTVILQGSALDYTFSKHGAHLIFKIKEGLTGHHCVSQLAEKFKLPEQQLCDILSVLTEDNTVIDLSDVLNTESRDEYLNLFFKICDQWASDIFNQPFWQVMKSGKASQSLILGWGVEFYHRVIGANEHNAIAAAYCTDPKIQYWLKRHHDEEFHHGNLFFLKGLEDCGIEAARVPLLQPLPSSRALIDYMIMLGTSDTVAYTTTYAIMHSPRQGQTVVRINQQFDQFSIDYPFAAPLFNAFRQHTLLDKELGHDETLTFQRVCELYGVPSMENRMKYLYAAYGMVIRFSEFFNGIYNHYASLSQLPLQKTMKDTVAENVYA